MTHALYADLVEKGTCSPAKNGPTIDGIFFPAKIIVFVISG
jgi:hypothetical protein